jgi:hypothetical protein
MATAAPKPSTPWELAASLIEDDADLLRLSGSSPPPTSMANLGWIDTSTEGISIGGEFGGGQWRLLDMLKTSPRWGVGEMRSRNRARLVLVFSDGSLV